MRLKPRIMAGVLAVTMVVTLLQYPTGTVRAEEPTQETVDITDETNKTTDETENTITPDKTQEQEKDKAPDPSDADDTTTDDTEETEKGQKPNEGKDDTPDEEEKGKDSNKKDNQNEEEDGNNKTKDNNEETTDKPDTAPNITQDDLEVKSEEELKGNAGITTITTDVSGTCGENLTWSLNQDSGILRISGSGIMYGYYENYCPWRDYYSKIKEVVINEGVGSIGYHAFYNCAGLTDVTIPSSVSFIDERAFSGCSNLTTVTFLDGDKALSIDEYAFSDCTSLIKLTLPDRLTYIGSAAFYKCSSLADIKIPEKVEAIYQYAFWYTNLTYVYIPDSVTRMPENPFRSCSYLKEISVGANNPKFTDVDGVLFNKEMTRLYSYPIAKDGDFYSIPDTVTTVGFDAFYSSNLSSVGIPKDCAFIDNDAFTECKRLSDIYYAGSESDWKKVSINYGLSFEPSNLPILKATIHYNSTGPDDVNTNKKTIGGTLRSGDGWAISWICRYLLDADGNPYDGRIDITVNDHTDTTEELYLYNETSESGLPFPWELEPYNIPKSAINTLLIEGKPAKKLRIIANSFKDYTGLETVALSHVSGIDSNAFNGCTSLKSVVFPNGEADLVIIDNGAFENCTGLAEMSFCSSLTRIGAKAFQNTALGTITLGSNITEIGDDAFSGCKNLLIQCFKDSFAHRYAQKNNIPFRLMDDTSVQTFEDVYYYDTIAEAGVHVNLTWCWDDLLKGDSSVYNANLGKMGVALSAAVEGSVADVCKILIGKDYDRAKGLGCDNVKYSSTSPGAVFGHKTIIKSGGKKEHIIFVVIRGTTSALDGLNDLKSAMGLDNWGASDVYLELTSCLNEWRKEFGDINPDNTKFFVTGHSLGGACANIISVVLSNAFGEENVFGYTYAAPSPFTHKSVTKDCKNIHNFLCYQDNVPSRISTQPFWYGNGYFTWFFVNEASPRTANIYKRLTGENWKDTYNAHFFFRLHAPSIYMAFLMTNLDINNIQNGINYIRAKCPVDIEVYNSNNELVGRIANDEADYDNYTSDVMLAVTDGAKYVYFLNDDTYTINFTGTGDGTMAYTAATKDMNSNTIRETKVYSDVKIDSGKRLKSIVSSYDATNAGNLVEIPDVELLVIDSSGDTIARVLSDNEAASSGENNGTEIPINNEDDPGNDETGNVPGENKPSVEKPGSSPSGNSGSNTNSGDGRNESSTTASSIINSGIKTVVETWKPTTPDEKKRYACMGKEAVQYILSKDNTYRIVIENAMQGPMCFKSFEAVLGGYTIGRTYNVYTLPDTAYSMDKEIQFTLKIPTDIYKKDREYKMICVTKGGQPIIYNDLDTNPETITVKTNKFYAYALIYKQK